MDKLQALKIFCSVAETLQFRETANQLAISPQVVSRIISELEQELGDTLFQRNTRQVQLSDFGQQLLPSAQQIIAQSEQFFSSKPQTNQTELMGIVRITVPDAPLMYQLLTKLLTKLQPYPHLQIDWRMDMKLSDKVAERIDIGIRMGNPPTDNTLIVRKATTFQEKIVASPRLIEQLGLPKSWQDLTNYPLAAFIHESFGRHWEWELDENTRLKPHKPVFLGNNLHSHLLATLNGNCIAYLHDLACEPYLSTGELVEIFPELPRTQWGVYVYRPHRQITPPRIKFIFDLLTELLSENSP